MKGELQEVLRSQGAFSLENHTILMGYVGSLAHGTHVPQENPNSFDDIDIMGIVVPPRPYYLGLMKWEGSQFIKGKWDITTYEVTKYVRLLLKSNPNVLSLLWLEPNDYLKISPAGQMLLDARQIFVSKQAYHSFFGYAKSQLHRMTHFQKYEGYMGAKRKALVDKFGYDVKNASHLMRLLRMCLEYLTEGKLYVKRHSDAKELIEIKQGQWELAKIKEEADRMFRLIEEAYVRSTLPGEPSWSAANQLVMDILTMRLG